MPTDNGYSNQKKKGIAQFETIHNIGSGAYGKSVAPKGLFQISLASESIVSVSDIIGSNGQVQFWNIEITAHGASVGNVFRIDAGSLFNSEYEIIQVIDADNFYILPITDIKPAALDTGVVMGWVTSKVTSDGSVNVAITDAPTSYNYNGVAQTVEQDVLYSANNRALPSLAFIIKDGIQVPITKDPYIDANTVAMPVEIVAASGMAINITTGDINVRTTAAGSSFDSMRIGDGTNLLGINASSEGKVNDADANTKLGLINGKLQDNGVVDSGNSSVAPLGIGGVFTGTAFEVTKYASINVCLISDVASATDGVKVEFSEDGTNWDHSHKTTYSAATGIGYIFNAEFKFARIVYTNGAVAQTYFRLQTIFKSNYVAPSLYTLDQTVTGSMFAQLNKSTIIGKTTGMSGGFVDVKVTPSGALTTESAVTGSVSVTNFPATQAVTGTFWQTTQPVSGSVSVSNFPATQAVTGTFWQTTQPVSGSVSVSNFPSTQNVAPQTSSGTITNTQKTVGLTAVRATVSGSAPNADRKKLMIKPSKNNTGAVYLGSSSVTTSNGLEIIGPDRLEFVLEAYDYYLISDTAAQVVEIIEVA